MSQGQHGNSRCIIGVVASAHHRRDAQTDFPFAAGQRLRFSRDERIGVDHGRGVDRVAHDREVGLVLKRHRVHVECEYLRVRHNRRQVGPDLVETLVVGERTDERPQAKHILADLMLQEVGEIWLGSGDLDMGDDGYGHQVSDRNRGV